MSGTAEEYEMATKEQFKRAQEGLDSLWEGDFREEFDRPKRCIQRGGGPGGYCYLRTARVTRFEA
jgi:hypothetical protein